MYVVLHQTGCLMSCAMVWLWLFRHHSCCVGWHSIPVAWHWHSLVAMNCPAAEMDEHLEKEEPRCTTAVVGMHRSHPLLIGIAGFGRAEWQLQWHPKQGESGHAQSYFRSPAFIWKRKDKEGKPKILTVDIGEQFSCGLLIAGTSLLPLGITTVTSLKCRFCSNTALGW